jgi:Dolichyl-phosphate-mannose-protein mannosyltransferase
VVSAPARLLGRSDALVRTARPQVAVMGAQFVAGIGNVLFAVVVARALDPGEYAGVATFLALFVLLHVPSAALSAAGALSPERLERRPRWIVGAGLAVGAALIAGSGPVSAAAGLDRRLIVALGLAAPAAALLGLVRGMAYGRERLARVSASLVVEPAARLAVGIPLALLLGPLGAAIGAVASGYAALAVCAGGRAELPPEPRPGVPARVAATLGISFVLLAVVQSVDLLAANRVLADGEAARFAVLSTIGGAAFFATATIPLVLLPSVRRGRDHAAPTAYALTAASGLTITAVATVLAAPIVGVAFGEEYGDVAHLVGAYVLAMALLGLVRVEVARRAAEGGSTTITAVTAVAIGAAAIAEAVAIVVWSDRAESVVAITLFTVATLAVVVELPNVIRWRPPRVRARPAIAGRDWRRWSALGALCLVAAVLRMATSRGLWVDEAISVRQAQLPLGTMLADVRDSDVHPPLHHSMLWATVRLFGTSEFAARLPSLIAGVALVPVMTWTGRLLYDRRTGWVAAVLAAIAPFAVWYSQEARMYSLFMLLAALAIGAQVRTLRHGETRDWALLGAVTAAMLWTQYFAVLPVLVQQAAFAAVLWRDRHDHLRRRRLIRGWLISAAVVAVAMLPLLPILLDQLAAYGQRGAGLTPGQAGAGSSTLGSSISVYAVGANLIWATLGYHADGVMVQLAAMWPLLMLLALVMLGRGRSGRSVYLLALVVVPMAALFVVGSMKRDLFELRYFAGAVPALFLLAARVVTSTVIRRGALLLSAAVAAAALSIALVDQQLNGANPRLYDFEGALAEIAERAEPGDVVLYEPAYLADVVDYYAPGVEARPVGSAVPDADRTVFVLATERVIDAEDTSARLGHELAVLDRQREIVDVFERPNVRVWELT